jgi:hypothetical protein
MALSQLVYQMGVNLEEFVEFLNALNRTSGTQAVASSHDAAASRDERWSAVQQTLIESQWAKRYTSRAISVIAMLDPDYVDDPRQAERRVQAILRPPAKHHRKKSHGKSVRARHGSGRSRR